VGVGDGLIGPVVVPDAGRAGWIDVPTKRRLGRVEVRFSNTENTKNTRSSTKISGDSKPIGLSAPSGDFRHFARSAVSFFPVELRVFFVFSVLKTGQCISIGGDHGAPPPFQLLPRPVVRRPGAHRDVREQPT
jgi:hypothetical protein